MFWRDHAEKWVRDLPVGTVFNSDDLVEAIGSPDPKHEPNARNNAVGGLFRDLHKFKILRPVGYAKSRQPHRKGGMIRVWKRV